MEISLKTNAYKELKKQVKLIMGRIDKKRSTQIFLRRSEGLLIQNELTKDISNIPRHVGKCKTYCYSKDSASKVDSQRRRVATESPSVIAKTLLTQEEKENHKKILIALKDQTTYKQQSSPLQSVSSTNNLRPQLQQLSNYLTVNDKSILEKRQKLIQMLILCLMRKCHGKLYEGLDIAIQVASYFQPKQGSENMLKCITLRLMGKIFDQILKKESFQRKYNLQGRNGSKTKRHSSFMIMTLTSKRAFFNKFAQQYNKCKLTKQISYLKLKNKIDRNKTKLNIGPKIKLNIGEELNQQMCISNNKCIKSGNGSHIFKEISSVKDVKSFRDIKSINEVNSAKLEQPQLPSQDTVIYKISSKLAVSLPKPQVLFANSLDEQVHNYSVVVHQRSSENEGNLFSYQFPSLLDEVVERKDFSKLIAALNSIFFAESQCYTESHLLKLLFSPLLILFTAILILFMVMFYLAELPFMLFVLIFSLISLGLIGTCSKLLLSEEQSLKSSRNGELIARQLSKWNNKYWVKNVKFKSTQGYESLIICFSNNSPTDNQSSSLSADSINESQEQSEYRKQSYVSIMGQGIHSLPRLSKLESQPTLSSHTVKPISDFEVIGQQQSPVLCLPGNTLNQSQGNTQRKSSENSQNKNSKSNQSHSSESQTPQRDCSTKRAFSVPISRHDNRVPSDLDSESGDSVVM